jgi:ABC-type Fe3+ transport system permease subunit
MSVRRPATSSRGQARFFKEMKSFKRATAAAAAVVVAVVVLVAVVVSSTVAAASRRTTMKRNTNNTLRPRRMRSRAFALILAHLMHTFGVLVLCRHRRGPRICWRRARRFGGQTKERKPAAVSEWSGLVGTAFIAGQEPLASR